MSLKLTKTLLFTTSILLSGLPHLNALTRTDRDFRIFQFPANAIPRIDGDVKDWDMVPDSYAVRTPELWDSVGKHETIQPDSLDISVKVGWVKGMSRLYFLYEAYDQYWDFSLPGLKNDTFEIVVDGDLSGGPLIGRFRHNPEHMGEREAFYRMQGEHAQNYHIFTPARNKSWAMYWGPQQWLKELPWANAAYSYDFEPGEAGHLKLEFYVTLFDHASMEGPSHSEMTRLIEGKLLGLCWAVIDYDDVGSDRNNGFWNLSSEHTMYGNASELVPFRLMPLEPEFSQAGKAFWTCRIIDLEQRIVRFQDATAGDVTLWHWDFGDGQTSNEQHPMHTYTEGGNYVVTLTVDGPHGPSHFSRVWDVTLP